MRPEISNELLLQVIQAWDPSKAEDWLVRSHGSLICLDFGIRHRDGEIFDVDLMSPWRKHCELVEFLLKDRPHLSPNREVEWTREVLKSCRKACGVTWSCDPWNRILDRPSFSNIVERIKSYEYLKAWKESRTTNIDFKDPSYLESVSCREPEESDDELCARLTAAIKVPALYSWKTKTLKGVPTPATYEQLCPHCNGSKEVRGWLGKEVCNAC